MDMILYNPVEETENNHCNCDPQLSELDLLASMSLSEDQFIVNDKVNLEELKDCIEKRTMELRSSKVYFNVNINLELSAGSMVLCFQFVKYTKICVEGKIIRVLCFIFRSEALKRSHQTLLNTDLRVYLPSNCCGEVCLLNATEWVRECASEYVSSDATTSTSRESTAQATDSILMQLWIYSHRVSNRHEGKDLVELAKELSLSGFSIPGKPSAICVEGPQSTREQFWIRLRRTTWKKLLIRHREDIPFGSTHDDMAGQRKFSIFEEKVFDVNGLRKSCEFWPAVSFFKCHRMW